MSALLLAFASGCGATLQATGSQLQPAAVPVRAYPEIWLAGGLLEEDEIVLTALAAALAEGGDHRVERLDPAELEPARMGGRIPTTAVVLLVDVDIREDVRPTWDTQPVRICGPYGCTTHFEQVPSQVPWVRGTVQLRVHDGPTAQLLQRYVVRSDLYGGEPQELRLRVAEQLAQRCREAVSTFEREVTVEVFRLSGVVSEAVALAETGDWEGAREVLDRAVRDGAIAPLSAEDRARVFYDLGLARRFGPGSSVSEKSFDGAQRAFEQAARLDPRPMYDDALRDLESHRQAFRTLQAQRKATAQNFALAREKGSSPAPPPSYAQPVAPVEVLAAPAPPAEVDPAQLEPPR